MIAPDYAGPSTGEKTEMDVLSPKKRRRSGNEPPDTSLDDLYLIFEFLDTDMHKLIASNQFLTNLHVKTFLYQILAGLKYIHSSSVIHRDLKPANLLLTEDCSLKICDFGLSRVVKRESSDAIGRTLSGISDKKVIDSSDEEVNIEETAVAASDRMDDMEAGTAEEEVTKPSGGIHRTLTRHVVTRWYRAPELILLQQYDTAVDMWSVGCVLGELLSMQAENVRDYRNRRALFPGSACPSLSNDGLKNSARGESRGDRYDQLSIILDLIGSPTVRDVDQITDPQIRLFLRNQPVIAPKVRVFAGVKNMYLKHVHKQPLSSRFPGSDPVALDLLKRMITFNPADRITVDEALAHPYLASVRKPAVEFNAAAPMVMHIEDFDLSIERTQEFVSICWSSLLGRYEMPLLITFPHLNQMKREVLHYRNRNAALAKE